MLGGVVAGVRARASMFIQLRKRFSWTFICAASPVLFDFGRGELLNEQ